MGLLDRLSGGHSGSRGREDVAEHLGHLLNSARGFGCVRGDYGVKSETTWGATAPSTEPRSPLERLRVEIERNIVKFEPAISGSRVSLWSRTAGGRVVRFRLEGELASSQEKLGFWILFDVDTREFRIEEGAS